MKEETEKTSSRKQRKELQEEAEPGAFSPTRFFVAVQKRDASAVREMAKEAGREKQVSAFRSLFDFLLPPSSRWKTPKSSKGGWAEARASAIWALKEIGDVNALPAIAMSLVRERDVTVREAARAAILAFGSAATFPLLTVLREPVNWNQKGMLILIECLSAPTDLSLEQKKSVGDALIQILLNNVPLAPPRWHSASPRAAISGSLFIVMLFSFFSFPASTSWLFAVICILISLLAGRKFLNALTPSSASVQERHARRQLHQTAVTALIRLEDKRCLSSLIDIAFGLPRCSSRAVAQHALTRLLPYLAPQDTEMLAAPSLEFLTGALLSPLTEDLTLAILHALSVAGTGMSIKAVKRLTRWGHTQRIIDTAGRVLLILEERQERTQEARSLLRGSHAPSTAPNQLLRPASSQPETPAEQLLRPAGNE